ncbi:MAG: 30S ribosomal protein S6 [Candidatus Omnitrophica bacterium]|nr:30S ribosomal protein S6 [Candidatus Omnitrophota bacterium]
MVKYEAMFIIKPDLSEEERKTLFNQIQEVIGKNQGYVFSAAIWQEKRKFFFPIKKFHEGLYYLVNFSAPASAIKEINNIYKLNENILRVLITKQHNK